ncbi:PAS domain-containing protein [Streptomyces sp. A7024]|uniref:histidine kinase n=1 Tax=Streptomyces coryli TaxID=1128680 RepID=A0A6G4U2U1_9ACTN|nr:PAS domain-containing protein [Streptomyces coryli]
MSSRPSRGAARLAAILDALPDALVLVNTNGTVVAANPVALAAFERPGAALIGRGLLDLLPDFDPRRIPGSMRAPEDREPEAKQTKPTRMMARRTDGSEFPAEVTSANLEDGEAPDAFNGDHRFTGDELLMLVVRDLTGTLDTEAELARQRRQTEMILRAASEGIVGTDTDGRIVLVNPAAAHILGYRAGDLGGQELHPLLHHSRPDGSPLAYEETPLADTLSSGRKHRVRGQVLWAKDGRAVPVDLTTAPVRDGEQLVGAVLAFTDRRRLDALSARQDQLAAVLTDGLRGPLDQLRGELGALASDPAGQLWPEANQVLHHLSAGYGRMTALIDSVLSYQRLDAGRERLSPGPVALDAVVHEAVETSADLIGPGRAQFVVHAPEGVEAVVDGARLTQALAHLIADVAGVDATGRAPVPMAGSASVSASGDSTIVVAAAQRGDVVRVEVRGPHGGGDPVHEPLARGIARLHGGILQTHEVPGQGGSGSAYVLEVPVAGPSAAGRGSVPRAARDRAGETTVMPEPAAPGRGMAPPRGESAAAAGAGAGGAVHDGGTGAGHAGGTGAVHVGGTGAVPAGGTGEFPASETGAAAVGGTGAGHLGDTGTGPGPAGRRARRALATETGARQVPAQAGDPAAGAPMETDSQGGSHGDSQAQAVPAEGVPQGATSGGRRRASGTDAFLADDSYGGRGGALAEQEQQPDAGQDGTIGDRPSGRRRRRAAQDSGTGGHPSAGTAGGNQPVTPGTVGGNHPAAPGAPADHPVAPGSSAADQPETPGPVAVPGASEAGHPAAAGPAVNFPAAAGTPADGSPATPGGGTPAGGVPGAGRRRRPVGEGPVARNEEQPGGGDTAAGQPSGRRRRGAPVAEQGSGEVLTAAPGEAAPGVPRQAQVPPAEAGPAAQQQHTQSGRRARRPLTTEAERTPSQGTETGTGHAQPAQASGTMTPAAGPEAGPRPAAGDAAAAYGTGPGDASHPGPQAATGGTQGTGAYPQGSAQPGGRPHVRGPQAAAVADSEGPVASHGSGSAQRGHGHSADPHAATTGSQPGRAHDADPRPAAAGPQGGTGSYGPGTTGSAQPGARGQAGAQATASGDPHAPGPDTAETPEAHVTPDPTGRIPAPLTPEPSGTTRFARAVPAPAPPTAGQAQSGGISVRTLGQTHGRGVAFTPPPAEGEGEPQDPRVAGQQAADQGSGRRRRLGTPPHGTPTDARPHPGADAGTDAQERDRTGQSQAAADPRTPARPPHAAVDPRLNETAGRTYAVGAPDAAAVGRPEPLDGQHGVVEVDDDPDTALLRPIDDEMPPEPLDNPRRLLVWPEPDGATSQALTDRGYRPVVVRSREEVDTQIAAYPAALFVDPLTGPITRTALQALRTAAVAAEVPVLVTAGLGQATREAAYGADPAVLLKALAPRDSDTHPSRVLLFEEDPDIAVALTTALERRGMQVGHAADDQTAISLATQMRPNLVVMDLMQVRRRRAGIVDWLSANGLLSRMPMVVYTRADIDRNELPRLRSGETVLFLAERSTSAEVQSRIVDLLSKIGTN